MPKTPTRERVYLLALAVLTAVLTLIFNPGEPVGPDIDSYVPIANAIIADPGYLFDAQAFQANFWSMGYPTLLAIMLGVTGSLTGVTIFQAVLVGTLVFVPWLLTRHIPGPTRLISPAVLAVTPAIWGIGTSIAYETTYAVVLCYALAIAWSIRIAPPHSQVLTLILSGLSGLLLGIGVLIQSKTVIVLPVIAVLLLRTQRKAIWAGAVGFALPIVPWVIRNLFVLGTPNPLAENGPFNLWVGNNPVTTTGGSMLNPPPVPAGSSPTRAALEFVVSQPERAVELVILKAARLAQPLFIYPDLVQPGPGRTLLHALAAVLNLAILVGVVGYLGARLVSGPHGLPALTAPAILLVLFFVVHLPFIAEQRYLTPVLPVSIAVAVATWLTIWQRLRRRAITRK